eukprot:3588268-Amphidinium_carterae.1
MRGSLWFERWEGDTACLRFGAESSKLSCRPWVNSHRGPQGLQVVNPSGTFCSAGTIPTHFVRWVFGHAPPESLTHGQLVLPRTEQHPSECPRCRPGQ